MSDTAVHIEVPTSTNNFVQPSSVRFIQVGKSLVNLKYVVSIEPVTKPDGVLVSTTNNAFVERGITVDELAERSRLRWQRGGA